MYMGQPVEEDMGKYNISKTSKTVNISNELLRHYERLGLIEPERGENGYRFLPSGIWISCRASEDIAIWGSHFRKWKP